MSEGKSLEQRVVDLEKVIEKLLLQIESLKHSIKNVEEKTESLSQRMNKNHMR